MGDRVDMVSEFDNVEENISPKRRNIPGKDMKFKSPSKPYKEMMVEISNSTGIGRNSIVSIISEYKKTGTVTSPNKTRNKKCLFDYIDDLDRNALRQKVHSFWLRKDLPTIDKILHAVNEDPAFPDFKRTSLYSVIKKLDFVFTKRKRSSVLTEREDLLVWRQNYLYDVEEDKMTEVDENMVEIIDNLEPRVLTITGDTSNSDDLILP
ncbi:unnamed protein product [Macrosiphum euphorbiae]|uniref:Uncharacterized protein n=1 Tax=Macrosiphum euphorbiae TaxID=13131 RepID=A0AAV0VPS7_9HEMI|nr:unnamed protein product [Macrosiphum euphorbiae]